MQPLIAAWGWRDACLALGIGYLLLLVPAMLLVTKPAPRAARTVAAGPSREVWRLRPAVSVAWIGAASIFCCVTMAVPIVHLVALLVDRGLSASVIGSLMMTVMLAASAGRIFFGMTADRIGALATYTIASTLQTAMVYWFVALDPLPSLYLLAAVFGFGYGGVMTTLLLCVRAAVPPRAAGLSTAVVTMLAWGGMGIGGYQGGYCFDLSGSYTASFASAALAGIVNLLLVGGLALHLRWHRRAGGWIFGGRPVPVGGP
jgi:predicted MFS family arabinose efflux permease